ncbi:hypothetical protein BCR43DRAFT_532698 [Syncephalastrum racemosum]|uniref:P-loop containing nucleoside triphosphate hydrolase protein n=1 Tax=Syncephalastrum racemosum TaxID=13706 RepID=A0A1X2H397_SYNRA|nr:hypothetical protein BCR43DRAFT_532698 [Syncephalastrum racemosum]
MVKVRAIGISGPSCAGKTLDRDIPIDPKTQLANWDCPDALDFKKLKKTIQYVRQHAQLPEGSRSNEEKNTHDGSRHFGSTAATSLAKILKNLNDEDTVFLIVDGFMLYWDQDIYTDLDSKIFITASYDTLKYRRENRQGYSTAEGYWVDPPGYFDQIVWPEYVRWNKHLFEGKGHSEIEHSAVAGVLVLDTDKHSIEQTAITAGHHIASQLE